jgi:hypothetical protein
LAKGGEDKKMDRPGGPAKQTVKSSDAGLGRALRGIYDDTLRESIPDEMLDLLKKLS